MTGTARFILESPDLLGEWLPHFTALHPDAATPVLVRHTDEGYVYEAEVTA